ncbi:hypothetical protein Z947_2926 [Sulfitobacter geojensis]|nr:hypothetical protein Z947_2926 [Sulfitobacter geojensis]
MEKTRISACSAGLRLFLHVGGSVDKLDGQNFRLATLL